MKSVDTLKKGQDAAPETKEKPKAPQLSKEEREVLNVKLSAKAEELLAALGFDFEDPEVVHDEVEIRGPCICHKGDNPTGFTFYLNNGRWCCWTQGCHQKTGTDPLGLIRAVKRLNFPNAILWALNFVENHKVHHKTLEKLNKQREQRKRVKRETAWTEHNGQRVFADSCLSHLSSCASFCRHRKFDADLFSSYGIGYAKRPTMNGRVVVPVRNIKGEIVGFSGRLVNPEQPGPKWLHSGFKKNCNLFNIDRLFKFSLNTGNNTAVVCEGPFDVMKLMMAGVNNAVAVFGDDLGEGQLEILRRVGIQKVILAFDGDKAGQDATRRIQEKFEKSLVDIGTIRIGTRVHETLNAEGKIWNTDEWGAPDWGHEHLTTDIIQKIMKKEGVL